MKALLLLALASLSLSLQARTVCRVDIDGEAARPVQSPAPGVQAFSNGPLMILAQSSPGHSQRMQFTVIGGNPTKAAYVIAAFHDQNIHIAPEINGQQLSFSCLQK